MYEPKGSLVQFNLPPYIETYFEADDKNLFHPSVKIDAKTNEILTDYPIGFEWAKKQEKEIRERVVALLKSTEQGKKTVIVIVEHGIIKIFKNVEPDFLPSTNA